MTIGICTDSHAQLPATLVDRFGVAVVPITVRIGDCEYLDGLDLEADDYYRRVAEEPSAEVTTSCPSPGQFALAYDQLAERGCSQILSIHASAHANSALNAARLAVHTSPIPVRLVDTGTRSFGVSAAVWLAADAIAAGASLEAASSVAESLAPHIGNVFIVDGLDLAGGGSDRAVEVRSYRDGEVHVVDHVASGRAAVASMCDLASRWGEDLRVAVGTADCGVAPLSEALVAALARVPSVREVIRYRIGPSVAAYTGPGTISCCMFPASITAAP